MGQTKMETSFELCEIMFLTNNFMFDSHACFVFPPPLFFRLASLLLNFFFFLSMQSKNKLKQTCKQPCLNKRKGCSQAEEGKACPTQK